MTTVGDILKLVNEAAPFDLAEPWDNSGLLVGDTEAEVNLVWVALEVTDKLIEAAADAHVDLVLTHHPVIFHPMKRVTADDPTGRLVLKLAKAGISVISAHTNLDAADGGVNDCLAAALELTGIGPLPGFPCGRTGFLPGPMSGTQAAEWIEAKLSPSGIRLTGCPERPVSRIAVVSGAGGEGMEAALAWGAELFVTGEAKYHEALEARERGLFMAEAGHDSTELVVLKPWIRDLQKRADAVQLRVSFAAAPTETSPYSALYRSKKG